MNIFEYRDYKEVLHAQIDRNRDRRGYRSELAEAAGCQLSFLSQVLHSPIHLTPDHAAGLTAFWGLNESERDYFLELVNMARSGSRVLKAILAERLNEIRERHENLAARYKKREAMKPEDQALYYSAWYLSAIHILLTIPAFRTAPAIAKRLQLSPAAVQTALEQLARIGLVTQNGEAWAPSKNDIHLAKNSVLTVMNHSNWRNRALLDAHRREMTGLHYTAVHSLSRADYEKIKEMLLRLLDESRQVVRESPEEELVCLALDWFVV